jgi:hypothetical protein
MVMRASSSSIDIQQLVGGALKYEVKLLNAGVDAMRVYLNQAARFSNLASDTLQQVQEDKASLSGTARKLTEFGRQNAQAFAELSQRLSTSYYNELDRLAKGSLSAPAPARPAAHSRQATKAVTPAPKATRTVRRKTAKRA